MLPTMPTLQCGCGTSCLQKNQMGVVSFVIVRFQVGKESVAGVPVGMNTFPESKPLESGVHGFANED